MTCLRDLAVQDGLTEFYEVGPMKQLKAPEVLADLVGSLSKRVRFLFKDLHLLRSFLHKSNNHFP